MNSRLEPMANGIPVIQTKNLCRSYQMGDVKLDVLNKVNLMVKSGEFVALMGASGSGKTTLLHLLGCLDQSSSGEYWLEGVLVNSLKRNELADIRGYRVGFIFQNFNLLPRMSALDNVLLPLTYSHNRFSGLDQKEMASKQLQRVGLANRQQHLPSEMSGGERQRVAIARALITRPAVLLADEPTGNLDSTTGIAIMQLLRDINAEGVTIVLVTHDINIAAYADRTCIMRDGLLATGGAE